MNAFQKEIYQNYKKNKRNLPWRKTRNPYHILVSEIMLQQTQTSRVVEKFPQFIKRFPTLSSLACAQKRSVLIAWQGLGYNRRALLLHACAKKILTRHGGRIPREVKTLQSLPGIGPYTAAAIAIFAYNTPYPCIETNIRSVYIHFFFKGKKNIKDAEIFPYIKKTIDRINPREWYNALMDYGEKLKREQVNPGRQSAHYTSQSAFEGSHRQMRGRILRLIAKQKHIPERTLVTALDSDPERVRSALKELLQESFLKKKGAMISIG